ncbi:hypothetical protein RQN30_09305 [Arcanobacterium hippocoleae]
MRTALGEKIPFNRVDSKYFKVLQVSALIYTVICTIPFIVLGYFLEWMVSQEH